MQCQCQASAVSMSVSGEVGWEGPLPCHCQCWVKLDGRDTSTEIGVDGEGGLEEGGGGGVYSLCTVVL